MIEFATTRIKQGQSIAPQEFEDIASMHAQVVESLNLGLAIFLRGEEATARQLVERKKLIWQLESKAAERYFQRLRGAPLQNGGSDDFYLRILRDLKRIHSLIAALGYPILDRAGQLQNRLVEMSPGEPSVPEESLLTDAIAPKP